LVPQQELLELLVDKILVVVVALVEITQMAEQAVQVL
jgi:hypothetical protein